MSRPFPDTALGGRMHGAAVNSVTLVRDGPTPIGPGYADLAIDSAQILLDNGLELRGQRPFTVEAWGRTENSSGDGSDRFLFYVGSATGLGADAEFHFGLAGDRRPRVYWEQPSGTTLLDLTATDSQPLATWRHYACVAASDHAAIYVDGALAGSSAVTTVPLSMATMGAVIGADMLTSHSWHGQLTEFRFWDRARTADQLAGLRDQRGEPEWRKDGLVHRWPLAATQADYRLRADWEGSSGTAIDSSPSSNAGTYSAAGSSLTELGVLGEAARFDGSSGHVLIGGQPDIASGFTFEAWVRAEVGSGTVFNNQQFTLRLSSASALEALVTDSAGAAAGAQVAEVFPMSRWVHVAATWDTTTLTLFQDGVQRASAARAVLLSADVTSATLGTGYLDTPNSGYWTGELDESRFWTVIKSEGSVQRDMARALTGVEDGLVALWHLDDSRRVDGRDVLDVRVERGVGTVFSRLRIGRASVRLDNDSGLYSPERGDLRPGQRLDFDAQTDAGSTYTLFSGFAASFRTGAAVGNRDLIIAADDQSQFLSRTISTSLFVDTVTHSLTAAVVSATNLPNAGNVEGSGLSDGVPFGFLDEMSAGEALFRIAESGDHKYMVKGDGEIHVHGRNRNIFNAPVASFIDAGFALGYALDDQNIINEALIRGRKRTPTSAVTSVAGLGDLLPVIQAGETTEFFLAYQDPDTRETPLPVRSIPALTRSLDWRMTDEGNTDITSAGSVSLTAFATAAKVTAYNPTSDTALLSHLIISGHPLRREPEFRSTEIDSASQLAYEKRTFTIETELVQDFAFTRAYAEYMIANYAEPIAEIGFRPERNLLPELLAVDLNDLVHVVESHTLIGSDFLVRGVSHALSFSRVGAVHDAEYTLEMRQTKEWLQLDHETRGKLDVRKLGF